ncbi:MAG: NUDIX hydrolase [Vicinamibacterales bacterium]
MPSHAVTPKRARIVFAGRIFTVETSQVQMATGRTVAMEVVRHRGSVVLVPQPDPAHVILIRQYRFVINRTIWELPAGSLEQGEAPHRAARRECEEEIGLRPGRIERLGVYFPTPGFCDERMVFYACRDLSRPAKPAAQDEDEQIEPRTFTLRQAWALVRAGKIVDMKTVLGLAMVSGKVPLAATK